jgi:hypothetical protein
LAVVNVNAKPADAADKAALVEFYQFLGLSRKNEER